MKTFISEELISIGFEGISKSFFKCLKSASFKNKLSKTIKKNIVVKKMVSKSDIKHLNKMIKSSCGSFLEDVIKTEFKRIIKKFDKTGDLFELLFNDFWQRLLKLLEKDYPDLYNQYILNNIQNTLIKITEQIGIGNCGIEKLIEDKSIKLIEGIEEELNSKSSKKLSLKCFEIDDYSTEEKLNEAISNKETVFIKFYSPIEAFYRVLNFLTKKSCSNVLIIDRYETWKKIKDLGISNYILITTFPFDEIPVLESNCNIIFVDDSCSPVGHNVINLKKRTCTNIRKSLEEMGFNYEEISSLIEQTHGLFVPLYSKICDQSIICYRYQIDEKDENILCKLLLIKSFVENDFDLICSSLNVEKKELISLVTKYTKGENPLLYKNARGIITFSAFEYAWDILSKSISLDILKDSIKLFELLLRSSRKNKYEIQKNLIYGFCYCCYINRDSNFQQLIFNYFEDLFELIKKRENLRQILPIIVELTDLIPDKVVDCIDYFSTKHEIMAEIMKNINYRCDILWSLEKSVQITDLTYKSLEVLCKIDQFHLNDYGNSARNTLNDLFCPWYNLFPKIWKKSKSKFAKKLIKFYPNFWNILYNNFPHNNQVIHGNLLTLNFLGEKIDNTVTIDQYRCDVNSYFDICLEYCDFDIKKINEILKEIHYFSDEKINQFYSKLNFLLLKSNDNDKMFLKEEIRDYIYKHRFFSDADWAIGEEKLQLFITILNSINFSRNEYEYHYLFKNYCELSLLNPCPYKNENYHEINETKIDEARRNGLLEFKSLGLDLKFLMDLSVEETTILGEYISLIYCDNNEKEKIANMVFEARNFEIARRFCLNRVKGNFDELLSLSELYKNYSAYDSKKHSVILSCYHDLNEKILNYIDEQNQDVQKNYYSNHVLFFRDKNNNPTLVKRVLDKTLWYRHISIFIEYLYEGRLSLKLGDIFSYLKELSGQLYDFRIGVMDDYYISEVKKLLISYVDKDFDKLSIMAKIEETFYERDDENILYLNNFVSVYPNYIEEILSILYGKKEGDKTNAYTKLFNLKFCPGFYNGVFSNTIFSNWIDSFKSFCEQNEISEHALSVLGKMFAFSAPDTDDGIIPAKEIREFIENEDNDDLNREFAIATLNKRGVYTPDQGVSERMLANRFLEISDVLKENYPVCSKIYKWISDDYFGKAEYERKFDEI